jgi:hypothetical protein
MKANEPKQVDVSLEIGKKRVFACALDWPGWCRNGGDEEEALKALFNFGPRYARVVKGLQFPALKKPSALQVVERFEGGTTTDFGAPEVVSPRDSDTVDEATLNRFQQIMDACWDALEGAAQSAQGKELRKGPRGGGREVEAIVDHVIDAQVSYLSQLGWKVDKTLKSGDGSERLPLIRQAVQDALPPAARSELPAKGPRGGSRWPLRYFLRRAAWHILDHVWEIEDRSKPQS